MEIASFEKGQAKRKADQIVKEMKILQKSRRGESALVATPEEARTLIEAGAETVDNPKIDSVDGTKLGQLDYGGLIISYFSGSQEEVAA